RDSPYAGRSGSTPTRTSRRSGSSSRAGSRSRRCTAASTSWPTPRRRSRRWPTVTRSMSASVPIRDRRSPAPLRAERRHPMLVDMHAHVIPGALDPVGSQDHRGPQIGPCDDPHARLLENDRGMKFKAIDAFYSGERRLEELDRSGVDAEVVSPMPPLLDYALTGVEGLELSRQVNEFVVSLCEADPRRLHGMGMVPMQAPDLATAELSRVRDLGLAAVEIASNVLGRALHGEEYEEFWSEAERLEMPVFIHAMPADFGERLPAGLIPIAAFAV